MYIPSYFKICDFAHCFRIVGHTFYFLNKTGLSLVSLLVHRLEEWYTLGKNVVCVLEAQLYPTLCDPINCSLPGFCTWNSPDKNTGMGCHSILQGNLPNPGIEPGCPTLQADSLPFEPPGSHLDWLID